MSNSEPSQPPQVSPDGRFWWNGHEWIPFQTTGAAAPPVGTPPDIAEGVAGGLFKFLAILALPVLGLLVLLVLPGMVMAGAWSSVLVIVLLAGGVGYGVYRLKSGSR